MVYFLNRALLPHFVFFALLGGGWWAGHLSARRAGSLLAIWAVLTVGLLQMSLGGVYLTGAVAVMDIVLVLMIFKGDVEIP